MKYPDHRENKDQPQNPGDNNEYSEFFCMTVKDFSERWCRIVFSPVLRIQLSLFESWHRPFAGEVILDKLFILCLLQLPCFIYYEVMKNNSVFLTGLWGRWSETTNIVSHLCAKLGSGCFLHRLLHLNPPRFYRGRHYYTIKGISERFSKSSEVTHWDQSQQMD